MPVGNFREHDETFVEGHTEIYESDFDILVIVENEKVELNFKTLSKVLNPASSSVPAIPKCAKNGLS